MDRVISLAESKTLPSAGGKANALGAMIHEGFRIPNGFVVIISDAKANADLRSVIITSYEQLNTK